MVYSRFARQKYCASVNLSRYNNVAWLIAQEDTNSLYVVTEIRTSSNQMSSFSEKPI
jgi:hypothetical protein